MKAPFHVRHFIIKPHSQEMFRFKQQDIFETARDTIKQWNTADIWKY